MGLAMWSVLRMCCAWQPSTQPRRASHRPVSWASVTTETSATYNRRAMAITRRDAIVMSGSTLASLSLGALSGERLDAQAPAQQPAPQAPWPDQLVERPLREGFPALLPLNTDGSAPEHAPSAAGPITDPLMWRTPNRQAPEIDYDYKNLKVKVDTRGLGKLAGT